jgi:enterochelin esterase family protein
VNEFNLYQNYPNPFNPNTRIRYSLNKMEHVTLKIFDVLGNEIVELVNEVKHPGTYEVEFEDMDRKINSGVYFYRLSVGSTVTTKQMMYVK